MRAKDVMSDGVVSLSDNATVYEAAELLVSTGVSAMPVLDRNGFMIGIVSEADLVRRTEVGASPGSWLHRQLADDIAAAAEFVQAHSRRVVDVMAKNVITADEGATLSEVAELMLTHHVKRVPILRGRLVVGMVSRVDLLRALLSRQPSGDVPQPKVDAALQSSDEQLCSAVTAAVQGQGWSLARRSDVVVASGVVHLWGVVPNDTVLQAYRVAAASIPGVKGVEVHMHILPPSVMTDEKV